MEKTKKAPKKILLEILVERLGDRFESLDRYPWEWVVGVKNVVPGEASLYFEGETAVAAALAAIREIQREEPD